MAQFCLCRILSGISHKIHYRHQIKPNLDCIYSSLNLVSFNMIRLSVCIPPVPMHALTSCCVNSVPTRLKMATFCNKFKILRNAFLCPLSVLRASQAGQGRTEGSRLPINTAWPWHTPRLQTQRENYTNNSFHIQWDVIVVTIFLPILNQMEFHLVQNRKENCHHDHIPLNVKGIVCVVFSVHAAAAVRGSLGPYIVAREVLGGFALGPWCREAISFRALHQFQTGLQRGQCAPKQTHSKIAWVTKQTDICNKHIAFH